MGMSRFRDAGTLLKSRIFKDPMYEIRARLARSLFTLIIQQKKRLHKKGNKKWYQIVLYCDLFLR